ncbi:PD-(D/E)XK nuclease family protein [Leucobacter soli]|uniref:PD-(D/E)XK nuclease family protein n=1 Tax=Leucobacter soli TaxID=2812850 RepID=UPI003623784B
MNGRGGRADEAQRSLDATMGLFFALQRHEEQDSSQPIEQLLEELLESAVPEDSLAQRAQRDAVTVTTPQGTIGREFDLVAIVGAQDGAWPNTRARGSLLGAVALERWLRGGSADDPSRRDTIHDELRLYAQACSRACDELLVVAISDEDHHPSPFFGFGSAHLQEGMPSSRLTLRGATAAMRRRLVADPEDGDALGSLVELARSGAPGAHPDEWYGVSAPSTDAPLHDLGAPESRVPVSPSQMERAETCPLDWVIGALGGGSGTVEMNLGTLVHHAFETAQSDDPEQLLAGILREWRKLPFDADWDAERALGTAAEMAAGLADYLREFEASDRELVGRETGFNVPLGEAELRGKVDRLELRRRSEEWNSRCST